jgi:hypothetical protein
LQAGRVLFFFRERGIVFARGVLNPERILDAETLLESIERSRDKLLLPPGDPAAEYYDFILDRSLRAAIGFSSCHNSA